MGWTGVHVPCVYPIPRALRKCRLLARASVPRNDGVAVDMRRYLEETQKNIIELNRSRIKALEDVHRERMLRIEAEHAVLLLQDENTKLQTEIQLLTEKQRKAVEVSDPDEEPAKEDTKKTSAAAITLRYATGWSKAFIHYNVDSRGWTKSPGVNMVRQDREYVISVEGRCMEFVLNNGGDEWDQPYPVKEKRQNYKITEAGDFLLKDGSVRKL